MMFSEKLSVMRSLVDYRINQKDLGVQDIVWYFKECVMSRGPVMRDSVKQRVIVVDSAKQMAGRIINKL